MSSALGAVCQAKAPVPAVNKAVRHLALEPMQKGMKLDADLHIHTLSCGHAYATLTEMAAAAKAAGLKACAVTDHGPALLGSASLFHFRNLGCLPADICGVRIFTGVEANIIDSAGSLDLPAETLTRLELVTAGFHLSTGLDLGLADYTDHLLCAMNNPLLKIITHPDYPKFPTEVERVVLAAKQTGTALEVNRCSLESGGRDGNPDYCREMVRLAVKHNVLLSVGSDAHFTDQVGNFAAAVRLLQAYGVPAELVVNATLSGLERFICSGKTPRP